MSKKQILFSITNGFWLIQPEYAHASAGLVQKVLNGETVFESASKYDAEEHAEKLSVGCFAIKPTGEVVFGNRYNPFMNATPGSIAVLGVSGPILKYDNCGDLGTKSYSNLLNKAAANPNISGVLLVVDSPGGTVDGTQELAAHVKSFKKPIVSLVDGLMASAAYWIGSSAKKVIANNNTAMIGSIGTMISFADMQPMYEKAGVKFHTVYADASKDKNKDFDEARKGNYDLLKEKLNAINDEFLSAVKSNRPGIKETALTGKTFMASDAVNEKLIDSIGDFDFAVSELQALIDAPEPNNEETNKPKNTMKKITLMATQAFLVALCGATFKAGETSVDVDATDELTGKIEGALAAGDKASKDLTAALERITALEASEKTASDKAAKLEQELTTLKASNPGSTNTIKNGNVEDTGNAGAADSNKEVWDLPHNKSVLDNPLFN